MAKVEVVRTDINGQESERLNISASRLRLLLKVVGQAEFTSQWWAGNPISMMARHWEVEDRDIEQLRYYWALADRQRATAHASSNGRLKKEDLEPWIRGLIQEQVEMVRQDLARLVEAAVEKALK